PTPERNASVASIACPVWILGGGYAADVEVLWRALISHQLERGVGADRSCMTAFALTRRSLAVATTIHHIHDTRRYRPRSVGSRRLLIFLLLGCPAREPAMHQGCSGRTIGSRDRRPQPGVAIACEVADVLGRDNHGIARSADGRGAGGEDDIGVEGV